MNRYSSTADQLEGLANRTRDLERGLQQANQHADGLRRDNEQLKERLRRKDKRIDELLEEKFGLADQLQQKAMETPQLRLSRTGTASRVSSEPVAVEKEIRKPGTGFTATPSAGLEGRTDDGGASKDNDNEPNLQEWVAGRRASNVKPKLLNSATWVLSEVPEEERTAWKALMEEIALAEIEDGDAGVGRRADTPTSPAAGRGAKRRRLDSDASLSHTRHSFSRFDGDGHDSDEEDRGRSLYRPRRKNRGRRAYDPRNSFRRKAVCVHCWTTRQLCDFSPQCGNCLREKVPCVRKRCCEDDRCWNARCPCLHRGDWDEEDPAYIVEDGQMPWKR